MTNKLYTQSPNLIWHFKQASFTFDYPRTQKIISRRSRHAQKHLPPVDSWQWWLTYILRLSHEHNHTFKGHKILVERDNVLATLIQRTTDLPAYFCCEYRIQVAAFLRPDHMLPLSLVRSFFTLCAFIIADSVHLHVRSSEIVNASSEDPDPSPDFPPAYLQIAGERTWAALMRCTNRCPSKLEWEPKLTWSDLVSSIRGCFRCKWYGRYSDLPREAHLMSPNSSLRLMVYWFPRRC